MRLMAEVSPAVVTFLRRLAAHVAGQRTYLSFGERAALVDTIAQFDPSYSENRLGEDILFRNADLLRVALGQVADEGGASANYTLVAAIQLVLADNRFDDDDQDLVHWVGDSLGFERPRVDRAIEMAIGPTRPVGAAPVSDV